MTKEANKKLKEYMSLSYSIITKQYEDNGKIRFGLKIPDLPGVWADGETIEEAYASLIETKQIWFETYLEKGIDIPKPVSEKDFSGKFVLRPGPRLHMSLSKAAREKKVSLNQYIKTLLQQETKNADIRDEIKSLLDKFTKHDNATNKVLQTLSLRVKSLEDTFSATSGGFTMNLSQVQDKIYGDLALGASLVTASDSIDIESTYYVAPQTPKP